MHNARVLDPQGQPVVRFYNRKQRIDRDLDELVGLAKGMAADGVVSQAEADFLASWLRRNNEVCNHGAALLLYNRVAEMLSDHHLDTEEQAEPCRYFK